MCVVGSSDVELAGVRLMANSALNGGEGPLAAVGSWGLYYPKP